jgi:hypothetical protein
LDHSQLSILDMIIPNHKRPGIGAWSPNIYSIRNTLAEERRILSALIFVVDIE